MRRQRVDVIALNKQITQHDFLQHCLQRSELSAHKRRLALEHVPITDLRNSPFKDSFQSKALRKVNVIF